MCFATPDIIQGAMGFPFEKLFNMNMERTEYQKQQAKSLHSFSVGVLLYLTTFSLQQSWLTYPLVPLVIESKEYRRAARGERGQGMNI